MAGIKSLTLEVDDTAAAEVFYKEAFELGDIVRVRESQEPTSGFRGFTVSLVVSQPSTVEALVRSALDAGVDPAGSGSHRIAVTADAGYFTDPDNLV